MTGSDIQASMFINLGTTFVGSLVSIVVALWLQRSAILKSQRKLHEELQQLRQDIQQLRQDIRHSREDHKRILDAVRSSGTLSREQATEQIKWYLESVLMKIHQYQRLFFKNEWDTIFGTEQKDAVHEAVQGINKIIEDERHRLNIFFLEGGITLTSFLDKYVPLHAGFIGETKKTIEATLCRAIDEKLSKDSVEVSLYKIINTASRNALPDLIEHLHDHYNEVRPQRAFPLIVDENTF